MPGTAVEFPVDKRHALATMAGGTSFKQVTVQIFQTVAARAKAKLVAGG